MAEAHPDLVRSLIVSGSVVAMTDYISEATLERIGVRSLAELLLPESVKGGSRSTRKGKAIPTSSKGERKAPRAPTLAMANVASASSSAGAGPSAPTTSSSSPQHRRPPRAGADPLLIVCGCFSVVTAATALLCVAVNVLSAVQAFRAGSDIFGGIFRCYAVVFSLFVGVLETEWGFIIKFWKDFPISYIHV